MRTTRAGHASPCPSVCEHIERRLLDGCPYEKLASHPTAVHAVIEPERDLCEGDAWAALRSVGQPAP